MATAVDIGSLIESSPDIRGGRPRIAGTGVTVLRIAGWYKRGYSPEEIADNYGHLSLAQVHAAITYYHANQQQIDKELEDESLLYDRLADEDRRKKQYGP